MSYILDALRRADAERDRGAVPTLHARHEAVAGDDDGGRRRPWLPLAGGAVALVATGAVAAWLLLGGDRDVPRATTVAVGPAPVQPSPAAVVTAAPPALAPAPAAVTPATVARAPEGTAVATARGVSSTTAAASRPARGAVPRSVAADSSVDPTTTATATAAAPTPATAPPAAAAARRTDARVATAASAPGRADAAPDDRARVYAAVDLPDAVKKDLPRVSISGGSWSRDKASRMVMVNGQVLHEGDTVVPGLVLDAIRPKSAVLAWKGYRYEMAY